MAVRGGDRIRRNLKRIREEVADEMDAELGDIANELLSRSRAMAPQLEGDLIESGDVLRVRRGDRFLYVVFYTAPYAIVRHEDRYNLGPISSVKPPTPDGPVGRKFLQRPFERNADRWTEQLAVALERAIRGAVR